MELDVHTQTTRILLISFSSFQYAGGGERHALECLPYWLRAKSTFFLVQDHGSNKPLAGPNERVAVVRRRKYVENNSILKLLANIEVCLKLTQRVDASVAVTQYFFDVIPAYLAAVRHKCALILYLHHLFPSPLKTKRTFLSGSFHWLSQVLVVFLAQRRADLIFSPFSQHMSRWVPNVEIMPLLNGTLKVHHRDQGNKSKYQYSGCFIGRISREKGIEDILDIWSNVVKQNHKATLAVIGIASTRSALQLRRAIACRHLQGHIDFLGRVEERVKYEVLRNSTCFVFPSYEEGWAMVISEALAAGTPVVAYDLPAYEPFRGAITTVPLGDTDGFTEKVLSILQDDALRSEFAVRGLNLLERFDWKTIAKNEWLSAMRSLNESARGKDCRSGGLMKRSLLQRLSL